MSAYIPIKACTAHQNKGTKSIAIQKFKSNSKATSMPK